MMGKQNGQIKDRVSFDLIYEKAAPYYSNVERKSIDPVILIKCC